MIKIISNKYFLFTLLFLYNCVAFAHDCSSPGDCEETAGYNAALAITGGVIALGAGLISTWMPPEVPDVPESDFENEFGEEFDDQFDDEFSDEFDEGNEDKFDDDEFDDSAPDKNFDDEFDDDFSKEFDEKFKDEFDDAKSTDIDHKDEFDTKKPKVKEDITRKKNDLAKPVTKGKNIETEGGNLHTLQGIMDTSNNIKTVIQTTGLKGVSIWRGFLKQKHYGEATEHFYNTMKNLKSKGLTNLASKYAVKFNKLLRNKANSLIIKKTGAFKKFFKKMENSNSLGHLADGLTFLDNLNKKTDGGHAGWDVKTGAVVEEGVRIAFKTFVTKIPAIAVGDAVLSLAGGPNLDKLVDGSINLYKHSVSKVTDWVYSDHTSANVKLNSDFDFQKKRIEKMHLSPSEKGKKLRKVWKILKKSHGL